MQSPSKHCPQSLKFELHVSALYRALGFKTTHNIQILGRQVDVLVEQDYAGIGPLRIAIECKYRSEKNIGNEEIHDFINFVRAAVSADQIDRGVLVTNTGFTTAAKSAADGTSLVQLQTSEELENPILDVARPLRLAVDRYEKSDIHHGFIPLAATVKGDETHSFGTSHDIFQALCEWTNNQDMPPVAVLGDYGAGKTTIVDRLKYWHSQRYLAGKSRMIPVVFHLKEFYRVQDIDGLIEVTLRNEFHREIPSSLFWEAAESGRFVILLDGFDEMGQQVDKDRRQRHLILLSPLMTTRSPAIITCRPSYFVSQHEYDTAFAIFREQSQPLRPSFEKPKTDRDGQIRLQYEALRRDLMVRLLGSSGADLPKVTGLVTVDLCPFDETRIRAAFKQNAERLFRTTGVDWREVYRFLRSVYDLTDLMKRPILLTMILETVSSGAIDMKKKNLSMGPSALYQAYTDMKFDADWSKGLSRQFLTKAQRRSFAESVALLMLETDRLEVSYDELKTEAARPRTSVGKSELSDILARASLEELATDIQTCGFLARHEDGFFRFSHKSFMEFFVARVLRTNIDRLESTDAMRSKYLPKEILYFLGGFALIEPDLRKELVESARQQSKNRPYVERNMERNLVGALMYSGPRYDGLELSGMEISGIEITQVSLIKPRLTNVTIRDVGIKNSSWQDPLFDNTLLENTNAHGWEIVNGRGTIGLAGCRGNRWRWMNSHLDVTCADHEQQGIEIVLGEVAIEGRGRLLDVLGTEARLALKGKDLQVQGGVLRKCDTVVDDARLIGLELSMTNLEIWNGASLLGCKASGGVVRLGTRVDLSGSEFTGAAVVPRLEQEAKKRRVKNGKDFSFVNCALLGLPVDPWFPPKMDGCRGLIVIPRRPGEQGVSEEGRRLLKAVEESGYGEVEQNLFCAEWGILQDGGSELGELLEKISSVVEKQEGDALREAVARYGEVI